MDPRVLDQKGRPAFGQHTALYLRSDGSTGRVDLRERILFLKSKYIPGNGRFHRLGKRT